MVFLPKYMSDVVHMNPAKIGIYTSIPWLIYIPLSLLCGAVSDWLISSQMLSVTNTRKLLIAIGESALCHKKISPYMINMTFSLASLSDAGLQVAASYAACNADLAGTLFGGAIVIRGLYSSSAYIIPADLTPRYAATISAMAFTITGVMGIFIPLLVTSLTPNVCKLTNSSYLCHFHTT